MRKVIFGMTLSLECFIEGTIEDLGWHVPGGEVDADVFDFSNAIDTLFSGNLVYEATMTIRDLYLCSQVENYTGDSGKQQMQSQRAEQWEK